MASTPGVNVYAVTAQRLATASSLSEQEEIFEQALSNIKQSISYAKFDPAFVLEFDTATNSEEFIQIFDRYRADNRLWRDGTRRPFVESAARVAAQILELRSFPEGLVMTNQGLGGPIWGLISTALIILRNIVETGETLGLLSKRLNKCHDLYSNVYTRGQKLEEYVRKACVDFNEVVLQFCLVVGQELSRSRIRSLLSAATKSFQNQLISLSESLEGAARTVHESLTMDIYKSLKENKHAQAFPPVSTQPTSNNVSGRTETVCLPDMLSQTFTGRTWEMDRITSRLRMSDTIAYTKCVLTGIPGVGKSQLALHYASRNTRAQHNKGYDWILFSPAHDRVSLIRGISQIGAELNLFDDHLASTDQAMMASRLQRWLRSSTRWLFIFDSVTDSNDILKFLPTDAAGHVMITTRSSIVAESLVSRNNIVEVSHLDNSTGADLVFRLANLGIARTERQETAASGIVQFAQGLPLAIEQLVKFSRLANISWEDALDLVKNRSTFLRQQNFCSNHDQNHSTGTIISSTIQTLLRKNPRAVSLYQLLVYYNTSFIPLSLLETSTSKLAAHFGRTHTYSRGQNRSESDQMRLSHMANKTAQPFFLWAYQPWDVKAYIEIGRRLLHRGPYSKKCTQTDLPRIDSSSDIELIKLWTSQAKTLHEVLNDHVQLKDAINTLDDAGLLRRIRNQPAIWIHDLSADLTRTLIDITSVEVGRSTAHMAATTVYLNFPIPATLVSRDLSLAYLPHAITTLSHLQNAQILNDTTVGAELSHLVASTLIWTTGHSQDWTSGNGAMILKYYRHALIGYRQAWKRLETTPKMTWEQIMLSTYADYVKESIAARYAVIRHTLHYERFGQSAPWRCLQTMSRLASTLADSGQLDEALSLITAAVSFNERIFGYDEPETLEAVSLSVQIYSQKQEWDQAYAAAIKNARGKMGFHELTSFEGSESDRLALSRRYGGLRDTELGANLAAQCGNCASQIPGKEKEALIWYEISLDGRQRIYGDGSRDCSGIMRMVARGNEALGNLSASLFWFARAVDAMLQDKDFYKLMTEDYSKWDAIGANDQFASEAIGELRRMQAKVEEEQIILEVGLGRYVDSVLAQAHDWDLVKPEVRPGRLFE